MMKVSSLCAYNAYDVEEKLQDLRVATNTADTRWDFYDENLDYYLVDIKDILIFRQRLGLRGADPEDLLGAAEVLGVHWSEAESDLILQKRVFLKLMDSFPSFLKQLL